MKRIALHSVPRSGSTWLGSIIDAHPQINFKFQPLFSYTFKDYLDENSSKNRIINFFNEISNSNDDFLNQKHAKELGLIPIFEKENIEAIVYKEVRYNHLLENMMYKDQELLLIGLIRNPLSVIYSWWKAPKEFKTELGWNFEAEWMEAPSKNLNKKEEFNGYYKWKEVALLFLELEKKHPNRFYLLSYNDLLNDTLNKVKEIMKFIGLELDLQQEKFIKLSKNNNVEDAYAVFKRKSNDDQWKEKLPKNIIEYIKKDLKNTPLEIYLQ